MIKILHFVSKMDRGGQETFIMNVYRNIDRSKIQFNFLCTTSTPADYDNEIFSLGGHIYYLPPLKVNKGVRKYIQQIKDISLWLKNNKEKFDFVHLHTYHALDVYVHLKAFRIAKVENVIIHSHNTQGPHVYLHKFFRIWNNVFFKFTPLACSREAGIWLFNKKNIEVIYNGVEVQQFKFDENRRIEVRNELGLTNEIILGHVGRFNYQKNHDFLINVFEKYHKKNENSVLLLIGKGEREDEIKELVINKNLTDSVKFLGTCSNVNEYLSAFDLFVFPSLFEGLSVVLVEAQLNGLKILANTNTTDDAIISDNIMLLDIDSEEKWIKIIEKSDMKRTNNIDFDKFDIKNTVKKIENIYFKKMNY